MLGAQGIERNIRQAFFALNKFKWNWEINAKYEVVAEKCLGTNNT